MKRAGLAFWVSGWFSFCKDFFAAGGVAPCSVLLALGPISDSTLAPRRVYAGFWGFDLHPSPLLFFCVAACYWGSYAARRAFALLAKLLLALGLAFWLLAFLKRFLQHGLKLVADAVLQ